MTFLATFDIFSTKQNNAQSIWTKQKETQPKYIKKNQPKPTKLNPTKPNPTKPYNRAKRNQTLINIP